MMEQEFLIRLILSFFTGSLFITAATFIADKAGSKIGGIIMGLPSTALVAIFFMGWTQSAEFAAEATTGLIAVVAINMLFNLLCIILFKRLSFPLSLSIALVAWFIAAALLTLMRLESFGYSVAVFLLMLGISYWMAEHLLHVPSEGGGRLPLSFAQCLFRALLSGTMISLSVLMARIGGPILGGISSGFPAATISAMIITYLSRGKNFSAAVIKVITIGGSVTILTFAVAVRYSYLCCGLIAGTGISYAAALFAAYGTYTYLISRLA